MRTGYLDRTSGQWVDTAPPDQLPDAPPEPVADTAAPAMKGGPTGSTLAQRAAAIKVLRHPDATPKDIAAARTTLLGFTPRKVQVGEDGLVRPMPGPAGGLPGAPDINAQQMPPFDAPINLPGMRSVNIGDDGLARPTPEPGAPDINAQQMPPFDAPVNIPGMRSVNIGDDGLARPTPNPNPGVALGPGSLGLASPTMIAGNHPGIVEPGNIDLTSRPNVANADGSHSSVRSMSFQDKKGGPEILVPTVSEDGKIMNDDDAVDAYKKTGRHLGKFTNPDTASAYAQKLHEQQAGPLNSLITPPIPQPAGMQTALPGPSGEPAPDPTTMTKAQKARMIQANRQKNIGAL